MGLPPRTAEATFPSPHERQTAEGVTLLALGPKYSCDRSLTATTALPKVSGSCGITRRKKAVLNEAQVGTTNAGRWSESPARCGLAVIQAAPMPAARSRRAVECHPLRAA